MNILIRNNRERPYRASKHSITRIKNIAKPKASFVYKKPQDGRNKSKQAPTDTPI